MAGSTTNISIRMDSDLKAQADALFAELARRKTFDMNKLIKVAFHAKLSLQTRIRVMFRRRTRLRKKKSFNHMIDIVFAENNTMAAVGSSSNVAMYTRK